MYHKVSLIGNLGQEPETRFLANNNSVCSFSVATNRRWTNTDGSPGQETIWWRASAWGKLGEICQQYFSKGQLIFLEGRMTPDKETNGPRVWTDQSGQARAGYDLTVETMKMLGRRGEGNEYGGGYNQGYGQNQGRAAAPAPQAQQYGAPAPRQAAPQQYNAPQRQAPAPQQYGAPAQRPPAPAQRAPQSARRDRRSTMSAPQTADDDFGPDEIPF